ncbi:unnamed protein product [Cochlearia groenlandica]
MDPELSAPARFGISDEDWESCRDDGFEEAREGIIQNVSKVCEVAEEMCKEEEDKEEKETLFNLLVWSSSPKSLMSLLS